MYVVDMEFNAELCNKSTFCMKKIFYYCLCFDLYCSLIKWDLPSKSILRLIIGSWFGTLVQPFTYLCFDHEINLTAISFTFKSRNEVVTTNVTCLWLLAQQLKWVIQSQQPKCIWSLCLWFIMLMPLGKLRPIS